MDRAPLERGLSYHAKNVADKGIVCGWDGPVVFAWDLEKESVHTHKRLFDGTQIWVSQTAMWNSLGCTQQADIDLDPHWHVQSF